MTKKGNIISEVRNVLKALGNGVTFTADSLHSQDELQHKFTINQIAGTLQTLAKYKEVYRTNITPEDGSKYIVWSTTIPESGVRPKQIKVMGPRKAREKAIGKRNVDILGEISRLQKIGENQNKVVRCIEQAIDKLQSALDLLK